MSREKLLLACDLRAFIAPGNFHFLLVNNSPTQERGFRVLVIRPFFLLDAKVVRTLPLVVL
jgi:hypothetical protein